MICDNKVGDSDLRHQLLNVSELRILCVEESCRNSLDLLSTYTGRSLVVLFVLQTFACLSPQVCPLLQHEVDVFICLKSKSRTMWIWQKVKFKEYVTDVVVLKLGLWQISQSSNQWLQEVTRMLHSHMYCNTCLKGTSFLLPESVPYNSGSLYPSIFILMKIVYISLKIPILSEPLYYLFFQLVTSHRSYSKPSFCLTRSDKLVSLSFFVI